MIKKYFSVFLLLVIMLLALTACSSNKNNPSSHTVITQAVTEVVEDPSGFKLSYTQSDSLNPFYSETLNNQIVQNLVFESLFILDESYEPVPMLATSYSYTDDKTLSVTIASGNKFSDGTRLDAQSVVYSFNEAKNSPHWHNSLKPISSANAISSMVIEFKLEYQNPDAHKLLTFAIASSKADKKGYPIGSGRYKFGDGNGTVFLELNKKKSDFDPRFTKIPLINIASEDSIENAINIGNISYTFRDLSSGKNVKIQSNKKAVNLNNLVYIGMNCNAGITQNENIRRAISLAADRESIVKSAYQGYAKSAVSVFNSASAIGKQTAVFSKSADLSAARQAIDQSGISSDDLKIDILTNSNPSRVSVARMMKQQLEAIGFTVTVTKMKNKDYKEYVNNEAFSIYIGETKIPNDMNLSSFFANGGATSYGINTDSGKTAEAYKGYLNSENEIGSFVLNFTQEMPFVPLVYRQGMICYSKSLHGDMQGYVDNYFSNIQDWYYN